MICNVILAWELFHFLHFCLLHRNVWGIQNDFFCGFDMSILISTFRSLEIKNILISKGGSCKEVSRAKVQEPSHGKASHGKASQWAKLYFSIPYFQIQYICISAKAAFLAKDQSLGKIDLWDWFSCDLEGVYKCKKIGANLLLRWIPGVFITPGTYHFHF